MTTSAPAEGRPASERKPALELDSATVALGGKEVLRDVSFSVPEGNWIALIGPNGAGKTTAIRAALHLCSLTRGEVRIAGRPTAAMTERERARHAAYVPQDPLVPGGATVNDYVLLGRNPHLGFFGVEGSHDLAVVRHVLESLELTSFANRQVGTLSGGERRRVVLARALVQESPLLLLDEPTSELDLGHAQEVLDLIDHLRATRSITVVSAIHDLTLASQYADGLVLLDKGQVVASGDAAQVLTAERISRHYRARVDVHPGPPGSKGVVISPTRQRG